MRRQEVDYRDALSWAAKQDETAIEINTQYVYIFYIKVILFCIYIILYHTLLCIIGLMGANLLLCCRRKWPREALCVSHTKTQKIYISIRHFMPHKAKGGHHCERAILWLTIDVCMNKRFQRARVTLEGNGMMRILEFTKKRLLYDFFLIVILNK